MRKAAKPQVVSNMHTVDAQDTGAVVINGCEVPSAKLEPPHIIINVAEGRRRLSLGPAVAWLRDRLQQLARRLGLIRVSPTPCHCHTLRAWEEPTIVEVVRAPVKQKSQRKRRKRKRQTSQSRTRKTRVSAQAHSKEEP
jgi:hypothetical protein